MEYKDFKSKTEDVVWLAYKLKDELGGRISINKVGLWKEYLEGRYNLDHGRSVDFCILYSDKEFLRVSVGETSTYGYSYEDKVVALNGLKTAIGNIVRNGVSLGEPSVFYNVIEDGYKIPYLEYIYADKEETIKAFQNKTIFDDGTTPEDVIVFNLPKEPEKFGIIEDYCCVTPDVMDKYSISIIAMLKNKTDIETNELRNVMFENLNELFSADFNTLATYVTYNNDITYLVACIKNALSLTEEEKLSVIIWKNGNRICCVDYVNGHLIKYESRSKLFEYNFNICYDIRDGIKFDTNCALNASEITLKGVSEELQKINNLRNINDNSYVKSNNNLLKLVRRIDDK